MTEVYYEDRDTTLFLGDYRDFLKENSAETTWVCCSDPPYNISMKYDSYKDNITEEDYIHLLSYLREFPVAAIILYPEDTMKYLVPALGVPNAVSAWCYNSQLPRRFRLVNYYGMKPDYKRVLQPYKDYKDKRIQKRVAEGSEGTPIYEFWTDIQLVKNVSKEKTEHPCPIPIALADRIIRLVADKDSVIIDPFCGSGTVQVAAKQLGLKSIGIDTSSKYLDIAIKRLKEVEVNREQ